MNVYWPGCPGAKATKRGLDPDRVLRVVIVEGGYDRLSSYNCRITSKRRRTGYFGVSGGVVTFRNRGGNEE